MKREQDWVNRMQECLDVTDKRSFTWGNHDCALFASDVLWAMTGVDPASWFRNEYDKEESAYKALRRSPYSNEGEEGFNEVFSTVVNNLALEHDMKPIKPDYLHRGDLCLIKNHEDLYAMGIFTASGVACADRDGGWSLHERPDNNYCWRLKY